MHSYFKYSTTTFSHPRITYLAMWMAYTVWDNAGPNQLAQFSERTLEPKASLLFMGYGHPMTFLRSAVDLLVKHIQKAETFKGGAIASSPMSHIGTVSSIQKITTSGLEHILHPLSTVLRPCIDTPKSAFPAPVVVDRELLVT